MKAMIFAAGLGTRLKPITDRIPKALLPIGGKTLLEWQIEKLKSAGITDITINVHHFADMIEDFCHEKGDFGCTLHFSDEREMLLETGGGLFHAKAWLMKNDELRMKNDPILVMNVDILSNIDLKDFIAAWETTSPSVEEAWGCLAMLVVSERKTQRYFVFDEEQRLIGWTNIATGEKRGPYADSHIHRFTDSPTHPFTDSPTHPFTDTPTLLAFSGLQIVSPRIFELMEGYPEKFSITNFYIDQCGTEMIKAYVPTDYKMMDIGKIDHLQEAEAFAHKIANC